jgi:hemolysin activation/secretion protein
VLTIRIVEGSLEDIRIDGVQRLNPDYVRGRIAIATQPPLNVPRLLEALRLLQLDPLIANVSAELSAGSGPGTSLLNVQVTEAKTTSVQTFANNDRSPSVGEFRRGFTFRENNLSGLGDGLGFTYNNTDGSGGFDVNYTIPINPQNGTISFGYSNTPSRVLETPFDILNIRAFSRNYEITLRQPIAQSPSEEFALGITASRRESNTTLLEIPFPLSAGADDNGSTRVSALRFFQEYTQRGASEVISARSQFSVGLGIFDATINTTSPDSRFFSWRGQAQWVRLLAPETLLLVRGDVQVADRSLLAIEQYGIGGQNTLRGYRQDILLADNGALLSAEVRVPVIRWPEIGTIIHLVPFVDVGTAWNSSGASANPNTLASVGLGLQMAVSEHLNIRLDYGIPLVNTSASRKTLQENGLYFSINFNPF